MTELQVSLTSARLIEMDVDRDLIERAKADREAFAALYRRHYQRVANYVFRRVGEVHATEDLVAEVFLAALRSLPRYRYRGVPFEAWLLRIATNTVNRWAGRRRRVAETRLAAELSKESVRPTRIGDGAGDHDRARQAMLCLSPKHQSVLSLHYLEGLNVNEVAAVVGCSVGTVKSRLSRARDAIRKENHR